MMEGMWVNPKIAPLEAKIKDIVVRNRYYSIVRKKLKRERSLERFVNQRKQKLIDAGAIVEQISDIRFNISFLGVNYRYNPKNDMCYIQDTGELRGSGFMFLKNKIINKYGQNLVSNPLLHTKTIRSHS